MAAYTLSAYIQPSRNNIIYHLDKIRTIVNFESSLNSRQSLATLTALATSHLWYEHKTVIITLKRGAMATQNTTRNQHRGIFQRAFHG